MQRTPTELSERPAPPLGAIFEDLRGYDGGCATLERVFTWLWQEQPAYHTYRRLPLPELEQMPHCRPGRICTPRYTADLDQLDDRRLAVILWHMAVGISEEIFRAHNTALDVVRTAGHEVGEWDMAYTPPQLWARRDAFIWDVCAWVNFAGYVRPAHYVMPSVRVFQDFQPVPPMPADNLSRIVRAGAYEMEPTEYSVSAYGSAGDGDSDGVEIPSPEYDPSESGPTGEMGPSGPSGPQGPSGPARTGNQWLTDILRSGGGELGAGGG